MINDPGSDSGPPIASVRAAVYTFPTPEPEADGTLQWKATTAVTVTLEAGGRAGLGWTYSSPAAAAIVNEHLAGVAHQHRAFRIADAWEAMHRAGRNYGTKGLYAQAMSAVDIARWDLTARLLEIPVSMLAGGRCRNAIAIYGSGGFTTLTDSQLEDQVRWWRSAGATSMKIKIGEAWGTRPDRDLQRVQRLRELAGPHAELMVDANGGYSVGQARRIGHCLDELGVSWFEEPVSSDDPEGLALLRRTLRCDITAGEYAADLYDITALLSAVDCLQLDATRCGGYTGFLRGATLAAAHNLDVSAHCAPALHAPIATAVPNLRHIEYFADHARLEPELLDGVAAAQGGQLHPAADSSGHGLTLADRAEEHRTSGAVAAGG
jgi:L-alanine-DL-glutamate epimerase-like enolase superfamily enzyme